MKKIAFIVIVFLSACVATKNYVAKKYIQLYQIEALAPVKLENEHYVFENDTIKIDYAFCEEKGVLAFKITNNLNVPLYVDWSRSAFIRNDEKFNFWIDEVKTKAVAYYQGYNTSENYWRNVYTSFQNGHIVNYGIPYTLGLTEGQTLSASSTTRPEKVSFIPPHSFIIPPPRTLLHLFNVSGTKLRTDRDYIEVTGYNSDNKPVKMRRYFAGYAQKESILNFRNFLMLSTSKDFINEFFVDNGFFVSNISEMETGIFVESLKKPTNFFVNLPEAISIEHRLNVERK